MCNVDCHPGKKKKTWNPVGAEAKIKGGSFMQHEVCVLDLSMEYNLYDH